MLNGRPHRSPAPAPDQLVTIADDAKKPAVSAPAPSVAPVREIEISPWILAVILFALVIFGICIGFALSGEISSPPAPETPGNSYNGPSHAEAR